METLQMKKEVSQEVIDKLSLPNEDRDRLLNNDIDSNYFISLERLTNLHKIKESLSDNKVLKLGLEDYISQIQETVYERLFRFV
jgi:hypothetical protein